MPRRRRNCGRGRFARGWGCACDRGARLRRWTDRFPRCDRRSGKPLRQGGEAAGQRRGCHRHASRPVRADDIRGRHSRPRPRRGRPARTGGARPRCRAGARDPRSHPGGSRGGGAHPAARRPAHGRNGAGGARQWRRDPGDEPGRWDRGVRRYRTRAPTARGRRRGRRCSPPRPLRRALRRRGRSGSAGRLRRRTESRPADRRDGARNRRALGLHLPARADLAAHRRHHRRPAAHRRRNLARPRGRTRGPRASGGATAAVLKTGHVAHLQGIFSVRTNVGSEDMQSILLIAALTLAQAQAGSSQASSFTCWIRGPVDKLAERASPLDSIAVQIGAGTMKLCYSRPSARGRKVMGSLVPFDQPWRLGANEATSIQVPFAAEIAGVRVEPGTYTLYAIPGASKWQIVVNRGVQRWGVPIDNEVRAKDVGAGTVTTESLGVPVETLTLKFAPAAGNTTELVLEWEKTRF